MTASKGLLLICWAFLAGIFAGSFFVLTWLLLAEFFILFVIFTACSKKEKKFLFLGFLIVFFAFGFLRSSPSNVAPASSQAQESGLFFNLRNKLQNGLFQAMPFPESALTSALIFGDQEAIPYKWKTMLISAGLWHIVSVSGSHIAIIAGLLAQLGLFLRFGRIKANYSAMILLWLFIFLIGLPSTALRAGIMGTALLLASVFGRQNNSERIVFLTAGLMVLFQPGLLRDNIGFQLSFLAVLGIVYFNNFFQALFQKIGIIKKLGIDSVLAISFSAQVLTFPLLLYYFGQISLVSPLSNLAMAPILPYLMVFGFLTALLGALFAPLAYFTLLPTWVLAKYLAFITILCSKMPFATLGFTLSWQFLPIIYFLLFYWAFLLKKSPPHFLP